MTPPIIKRYLIALDQHKLIGLATFALITGISGVVAIQPPPPPSYLAKGLLAYNTPPRVFSDTGQQILEQGRRLTPELLLAENVVEAAAERVQTEPKDIKDSIEIRLPKEGDAPVIEIVYLADNPKIAEITTEVLMQKMVEQSRLVNTERLRAIIESIEKRLPEAEAELRAAEQQLERYVRVEGPAILAAQDGTLLGGITGSQQQQRQIDLTLEGVESQIASLQRQLGLTPDQAYTSSALSADPIIANLRSQILQADTQLELLRNQGYRDTHPNVATVLDQKQTYEKLLQERAAEVIGGSGVGEPLSPTRIRADSSLDPARQQLANRLVELQTQRETLVRQLAATQENEQELRQEYQQLPNKQLEQARLEQQVQLKKAFYDQLQTALADASAAETETVTSLSIAQAPQVRVEGEEGGNPVITLGIGAVVGLIAAGGLIFLLSTLDNTFYTPEDIRRVLVEREVPLLGELPLVRIIDSERGGETAILIKPDSPYLEPYERFRSSLRVENQSMKVVMIVSTVEGEGKTVSAYNLAIASAQAGRRTLLVEADLRSPSNAASLKVMSDPEASVEPLRYYSSKSGCIRLAPDIENLYIVPSPGPQRRAAAVVESSELRQLLEDARGRFDFVVIDTPALSRCNDALLLEPLTDGILMVTRPGYTQGSILTEAIDELTEAELPLLGAIINGIEQPLPPIGSRELEMESEEETEALEREDLDDSIPTGATRF